LQIFIIVAKHRKQPALPALPAPDFATRGGGRRAKGGAPRCSHGAGRLSQAVGRLFQAAGQLFSGHECRPRRPGAGSGGGWLSAVGGWRQRNGLTVSAWCGKCGKCGVLPAISNYSMFSGDFTIFGGSGIMGLPSLVSRADSTIIDHLYVLRSLGLAPKFVCTYRLKWESEEKPNISLMSVNE